MKNNEDSVDALLIDLHEINEEFQKNNPNKKITRNYYRKLRPNNEVEYEKKYGSFSNFYDKMVDTFRKPTRDDFDESKNTKDVYVNNKKYFVTCAVAGAPTHTKFLKSILTYCKYNNAELLVLPMRGVYKSDEYYDDEILKYQDRFFSRITFNKNLRIHDFKLNPQMINPLTGIKRLAPKSTSIVVASPKQQLITVPSSNTKLPHILQTTGAVTKPNYANNRIGRLSDQDHVVGGLVIEIVNEEFFHIRQIQCNDSTGGFHDLNKYYRNDSVIDSRAVCAVLGDIHSGFEDETAIAAWKECIHLTNPEFIILHDICDAVSISHHASNDIRQQVNRPSHMDTLEKELNVVGEMLLGWTREFPKKKFIITYGNHDDAVVRYLKEGRYVWDRFNHRLSLKLAEWMLDGKNPIQQYVEEKFKIKNCVWLKGDDDFKFKGIQLGAHGHRGSNGTRGNISNLEESFGMCILGHYHSPKILRDAWSVGTSTKLRIYYNTGPSNWLHASCLLYKNRQKQMIISIDGRWRLKE